MNAQSFRYLRGGSTNWGYIVVLIIITFLVAGGIFGYAKYVFEQISALSQMPEIEMEKPLK